MTSTPDRRWKDLTAAEKIEAVRQRVEREGKSYGQAAQILGCSRLAIAGVVERSQRKPDPIVSTRPSGWKGMRQSQAAAGGTRTATTRKADKSRKRALARILAPVVYAEGVPADPTPLLSSAWLALPGSTPVALVELPPGACKWPVSEKPWLFCCAQTESGLPYCAQHRKMAYKEPVRADNRQNERLDGRTPTLPSQLRS